MKTAVLSLLALGSANAKVFFSEDFGKGWDDRWTVSKWKGAEMGDFDVSAGKYFKDEDNKGLITTQDARFYGISSTFDSFSNKDKTLFIQFTVKYENDLECGGGYLKFGPKLEDGTKFGDPTPYNIMFGPDKCGANRRTHLIFTYNKKNVLKTADLPYKQDDFGESQLYTLKLTPKNKVTVEIGGSEVYSGDLESDWNLLEPKEIPDPDDTKPSDWVDEPMMDDPEDKKPEDWDQPEEIVDPDAKQPEDWDSEEDGDWEAPTIKNPDYKGEWKAKQISNPKYKGIWEQKKKANPDYVADDKLYLYDDFSFVGVDVWQVKAGTIFDSILITDDESEVKKGKTAWEELSKVEKELKKADEDKKAAEAPKTEEKEDEGTDPDDDDEGGDDEDL